MIIILMFKSIWFILSLTACGDNRDDGNQGVMAKRTRFQRGSSQMTTHTTKPATAHIDLITKVNV